MRAEAEQCSHYILKNWMILSLNILINSLVQFIFILKFHYIQDNIERQIANYYKEIQTNKIATE